MASTGSARGRLPLELVQYIADDLERQNAKRTLASLAATSRPLHALVVPVLYQRIVLTRVNASRVLGIPPRSPPASGDADARSLEREYDPRDSAFGDALGSSVGEHLAVREAEHVYSQRFRLPVDLAPTGDETDDEHFVPCSRRARPNPCLVHVQHLSLVQWPQPGLVAAVAASPAVLFPTVSHFAISARAVARCPKLHEAKDEGVHSFLTQLARAPHVCVGAPASEAASDTGRLQWIVGCLFTSEYSPVTLAVHNCPGQLEPNRGNAIQLARALGSAADFGWLRAEITLYLEELERVADLRHNKRFAFLAQVAHETRPRVPELATRLRFGGVTDAIGDPLYVAARDTEPEASRTVAELEAYLNAQDTWSDRWGGEHMFEASDGDELLHASLLAAQERARMLTRRVLRVEARLDTHVDESAVAAAEAELATARDAHTAALAELDASGPDTPRPELARLRDARHAAAVAVGMASRALKAVRAEADRRAILARHDAGLKYLLEELHAAEDAARDARYIYLHPRMKRRMRRLAEVPFPRGRISLSADACCVCGGETFKPRSLKQIIDDAWAASA